MTHNLKVFKRLLSSIPIKFLDKGKEKIHGIQHLHDNISHIYLNDGIQSFKVTSREEDTGVTVTL